MMRKEKPAKQMRGGGKGCQRELPRPPKQILWCRVCWYVEGARVCVCARARACVHACMRACMCASYMYACKCVCM